MKVKDLIEELSKFDHNLEVAILDGFNGGGVPRTINFGPIEFDGVPEFEGDEQADYDDIQTEPGNPIVIMGYGCY